MNLYLYLSDLLVMTKVLILLYSASITKSDNFFISYRNSYAVSLFHVSITPKQMCTVRSPDMQLLWIVGFSNYLPLFTVYPWLHFKLMQFLMQREVYGKFPFPWWHQILGIYLHQDITFWINNQHLQINSVI